MKNDHLFLALKCWIILFIGFIIPVSPTHAESSGIENARNGDTIYWWSFDQENIIETSIVKDWNIGPSSIVKKDLIDASGDSGIFVLDGIQQKKDSLYGNYEFVTGIRGNALKLDGFSTYAIRSPYHTNIKSGPLTIESWIALAGYPWSWAPVVDCSFRKMSGFFFGIDREGHVGFKIAAGSSWYELITSENIPLREWTHVAAVFEPNSAISIFINGKKVSSLKIKGNYVPPVRGRLSIGRNNYIQSWNDIVFTRAGKNSYFFLDALLDELKVSGRAKTTDELLNEYHSVDQLPAPALSKRDQFPTGAVGSRSFGAFFARLNYYKEWDDLWKVSDKPDLYVRFHESPVQLIFWRGTSFVPCWVTENNLWYTNGWLETWGSDVVSCAEPIMDRQCRYSSVRLIENTDARVVIHWRYALADAFYDIAAVADDGRGEWADEYYILYPDMIGVRRIESHYSRPVRNHDWHEQIILLPPGKYPDDAIEKDAISLVNMAGEIKDYSWHDEDLHHGLELTEPDDANIVMVNLKSSYRPFEVVPPDPVETGPGEKHPPLYRVISPKFLNRAMPDPLPSVYGWWDHWPVAKIPGDGKWVRIPDRPSHFSLGKFPWWKDYKLTPKSRTRIMLHGMTNKKPGELVPIAKSWLSPPKIDIASQFFKGGSYDQSERAYIINNTNEMGHSPCEFVLEASTESPAINPAIIINNWRGGIATLRINDETITKKTDFKQGVRKGSYGEDLIVWIRMEADEPVRITLE